MDHLRAVNYDSNVFFVVVAKDEFRLTRFYLTSCVL